MKLVDDVNLEKHLEHNLTSVEVVEVGVDKVEVEQSIVVRRLQFGHLTTPQIIARFFHNIFSFYL